MISLVRLSRVVLLELLSHAGSYTAGVRWSVQFHLSVCLSMSVSKFVCPRSKRETARAIDNKLRRPIVHGRISACTDLRSKVKVKFFFNI